MRLDDAFWAPRRAINATHTLKSQFEQLEATECLANFRRAAGRESGNFKGPVFADSDLYKWLEAASATLLQSDDAQLRALVNIAVRDIVGAQQPDGYLDTHFSLHPEKDRWARLSDDHQLYCMGHFIQAAVAHFRATGEATLLDVARRIAECLDREFGWEKDGQREMSDGHEEIELALIELFRATAENRYLQLAQFFIDVRGRGLISGRHYHQDHIPFRVRKEGQFSLQFFVMTITGFVWIPAIIEKLAVKHAVLREEVEQVFENGPRFRFVENGTRAGENVSMATGQTDSGRYLTVLFIFKPSGLSLILSARGMAPKERKRHERK